MANHVSLKLVSALIDTNDAAVIKMSTLSASQCVQRHFVKQQLILSDLEKTLCRIERAVDVTHHQG
jgi:hypothetical protein